MFCLVQVGAALTVGLSQKYFAVLCFFRHDCKLALRMYTDACAVFKLCAILRLFWWPQTLVIALHAVMAGPSVNNVG